MKMKAIIFSLFLIISIGEVQAQSIQEDFNKMLEAYKDVKNLYVEMENRVYKGNDLEKESSSIIRKKGNNYLYSLSEHAMLINDDYVVLVDKRNYNIVFDKFTSEQADRLNKVQMPIQEDLLAAYPKINYLGTKNNLKHYHLENDKEQIYKMDLFFDANTGFVKRAVYYHNPKLIAGNMRSEIDLKVINTKPAFSEKTFSETQFVVIEDGQGTAARAYTKYSVRNATKQN
jgi:outer membrane lipoprotein-sorting protein